MPMVTRMNPPIISAYFPIFSHHFFQNSIPRNDRKNVTIPIMIAGIVMLSVVAVRDIPTASASILVAIPSMMSDLYPNLFSMIFSSPHHFHHS